MRIAPALTFSFTVACALGVLSLGAARARADGSYKLTCAAAPTRKGAHAVARIQIQPGAGYHFNKDFPTAMTVTPPAGITVARPHQTAKDAVRLGESGAEFDVAYTATRRGQEVLPGELRFAVCSADTCNPKKEKLSCAIEVK